MAINFETHKAVVVIAAEKLHFGFTSVAKAVEFIENQLPPKSDVTSIVSEALDAGNEVYQILDIDSYSEVYGFDDDSDETE